MKKKQSVSFWAGAIMAASIAAICIISFFWMPADPEKMDTLNRFALPSAAHLLGTDQFGRDVLSRIMEASRWAGRRVLGHRGRAGGQHYWRIGGHAQRRGARSYYAVY